MEGPDSEGDGDGSTGSLYPVMPPSGPEPSPWSRESPDTPDETAASPLVDRPAEPPVPSAAPVAAKKRNVAKLVGIGVGVLGLLGGGAFAVKQITGGEKSNSPEQAIESFYGSLERGDAIGMAKVLVPGERDIMLDSLVPMMTELSRLDILDKNLDLNRVPGYEAKASNFKATSTKLRDDLAEVRVTGGSLKTSVDPSKLPIGSFVRDLLGDQLAKAKVQSSIDPLNVGGGNSPLVAQKVGNRWYLSLNYSAAESSRRSSASAFAVPVKGGGVPAKGADSPEAAVSDLLKAAADLDVRRVIELLPPDELPALHDYAGHFIADAEKALVQPRQLSDVKVQPQLHSTKVTDDRALVSIVDLPFTAAVSADDGTKVHAAYANKTLTGDMTTADGETIKADYRNNCVTLVVDSETKKGCGQKGMAKLFSDLSGQEINTDTLTDSGIDYGQSCVKNGRPARLGLVTVKQGGKWFVSPTRTMLDSMTAMMKSFDRKDLDCIKNQIQKTVSSFQGTFLPSASDSTFQAPTHPSKDPFSNVPDTFSTDDSFNADDTFNVDDTFSGEGNSSVDTLPLDTLPIDTRPVDDGLTFETAVPATVAAAPARAGQPQS
jgi:hypothetical protein